MQALNEWMAKRDTEMMLLQENAKHDKESALDMAISAAEAEMKSQLAGAAVGAGRTRTVDWYHECSCVP